ncbi:hypothetical protein NLG97_g3111 [Lecanicillium saksenae]|uniref:Uncharacterized protein n=1 Tax=Lecanicillium saksenae TaxID=468837 RepID=A0ACC1R0A9_9HYPO|nr:hypothetical protein NLG97_g3111 [Lecanicillium saksenae]
MLFSAVHTFFIFSILGAFGQAAYLNQCEPNSWEKLSPLLSPRQEHGTVALNETTIAILGGITAERNVWASTASMEFYDIPSNRWYTVTPAPMKVNHPNLAAVDGIIYLLGGLTEGPTVQEEAINWVATSESYRYDPKLGVWERLEPMPPGTERGSALVGVHGDMIYLAGGMTVLQVSYQDTVSTVTAFNTTSGKWQRLPPLAANIPQGRQHGFASVIDDALYVIGGRWFGQMNVQDSVFVLELNNQAPGWQVSDASMPVARGGLCGASIGCKIYAFGGEGNPNTYNGVFNQTEVFDTNGQKWADLAPMAVPRHGTNAVAVGNRIYIPGGGLQQDAKPVVYGGVISLQNTTAYFDAFCS